MRACLGTALCAGVILALLSGHGRAQQQPTPPPRDQPQPAAQPPQDQQPPVFRTGVNFVRVDVIANDADGQPVMDLTLDDFELIEDGKPRPIETFKLVEVAGFIPGPNGPPRQIRNDADERAEAQRDDVRLIGVFLDDYHVRRESSLRAREQLARFVQNELVPSDMIGLMYPLEPVSSVRFTRNHSSVSAGLMRFNGRKYDYEPMNDTERRYVYELTTESVEQVRNDVSLSALKGLIIRMGGLKEGRKALILVSEGYTNILPPQLERGGTRPDPSALARRDPTAGTDDITQRFNFFKTVDMDLALREVYDLANKNNVAIYAVDPRGLTPGEFGADQPNISIRADWDQLENTMETLRTLAERTDGAAVINRSDLTVAMRQLIRDSSAYYLLGYTGGAPPDGRFHEIRVRVKRPGVQLRYREGYWAPTREDAVRTAEAPRPRPGPPPEIEAALNSLAAVTRERVIRTWIATERGDAGRTRITFLWEPAPNTGGRGERPNVVALTAVGTDGSPVFRGRITAAPAAAGTAVTGARTSFEAPPGAVQLRVSIEDANGGVLDSFVREIQVPDLTSPETKLSTPAVFRARTLREAQQIAASLDAVPTTSREFSRTERVIVRVSAYGPGTESPAVTARLLSRNGQTVLDVPVISGAGGKPQLELQLAALAPGDYVLEISASAADRSVSELIAIRVTG